MLGALLGINAIPEYMRDKVMNFDCTNVPHHEQGFGRARPDFLSVKNHAFKNIVKLL